MFRSRFSFCVLCGVIGLALAWLLAAPQPAGAGEKKVSFIDDVAPILAKNCFSCHSAKLKKGKFDMMTYAGFRTGGRKEDPIDPGQPKKSYIIQVLTSTGPERMPPKEIDAPLPQDKIDIIARWIEQGAKLDAGIDPKADLVRELRIRFKPPAIKETYPMPQLVNALAFTPDSKKMVVGGQHELTVWDIESGKLEKRIWTRSERALSMAFLADGKLAVAGSRPGKEGDVRIYDINGPSTKNLGGVPVLDGVDNNNVLIKTLVQTDDSIHMVAVSPDGKKLAAAGIDKIVRVWDVDSWKLDQSFENHADWVFGLAFSADGKFLVTGSRDKTAKIWDLVDKQSVVTFSDHANGVNAVAMTADGKFGISCGEDGNIRQWQATDAGKTLGKQLRVIGSHGKPVIKMAYHPDAKNPVLASCGADGSVRLWNPSTGTAIKTLSGLSDWAYTVALNPDATLVAGGAWNGEVCVWRVSDGSQVKLFVASPGHVAKTAEGPKK